MLMFDTNGKSEKDILKLQTLAIITRTNKVEQYDSMKEKEFFSVSKTFYFLLYVVLKYLTSISFTPQDY